MKGGRCDVSLIKACKASFVYAFLFFVIFAIYSQTRHFSFTNFDDDYYVLLNHVVSQGITAQGIRWAFSFTDVGYFHPIAWLSHMLDCELFGMDSGAHHMVNVGLHFLNSILIFVLFRRTTGSFFKSAAVAVFFSIHPINVDTVAWVAQRKNLLSVFFGLLSILMYTEYSDKRMPYVYLISIASFAISLMAKPTLATLPVILILLDYWPLGRLFLKDKEKKVGSAWRLLNKKVIIEKMPLLLVSIIIIGTASFSTRQHGIDITTNMVPINYRLSNILNSIVIYIQKIVCPTKLTVHHPFPIHIDFAFTILSAGIILCLSFAGWLSFRRYPYYTIGWLWFLMSLLPVIGIKMAGLWPSYAERWMYFPAIGILIILVWGISDISYYFACQRSLLPLTCVVIATLFMMTAWVQTGYWRNSITLFTHALDVTKNNDEAHFRLADALAKKGRIDEAISHYKKAIQIYPNFEAAHRDLGILLITKRRDFEGAVEHLKKALALMPRSADLNNNLGVALYLKGDAQAAKSYIRKALEIDPRNPQALENWKTINGLPMNETMSKSDG